MSEAHDLYHAANEQKKASRDVPGIVQPGATGVIYCTERASANGFKGNEDPEWANFGQGAPEVGAIPGGSERPTSIDLVALGEDCLEYAPTTGAKGLRVAVAKLYNEMYRQGKESQYTYKNICIVPGGRAGLTRVAAVIGDVYTAYQIPEYTAYDPMLSVFRRLVPIPSSLKEEDGYQLNVDDLKESIKSQGITCVVASNPRNPTGQSVVDKDLEELVKISRGGTTVILDEFYSWYNYREGEEGVSHSAARYVEDVNKDSTVLIDGLTKNFRLPGFRCCWVIGPEKLVEALSQSGSFLDGGASHPIQLAAIPLLDAKRVQQDKVALQRHFKAKRDHVLNRLAEMGLAVKHPPVATFYIWLDLSSLPEPINSGLVFFEELLKERCIVVPGIFFDINPNHRRNLLDSPCHHFVRLSFGPPMDQLDRGLDSIQRVLKNAKTHVDTHGHLQGFVGDYKESANGDVDHPGQGS